MTFRKFVKSEPAILAVIIRLVFYFGSFNPWYWLVPFIETNYHKFDKLEEAFFFIEKDYDPYAIGHIFQVINCITS